MKTICFAVLFAGLVMAGRAETFTGVITDTMCGAAHKMMKEHPDDQCVKMCAKVQYSYALFDGTRVIQLSDQKTPARFAAQKVRVTGTLNPKTNTIKVSSIERIEAN